MPNALPVTQSRRPCTIADVIAAGLELDVQCTCSARVAVFQPEGVAARFPPELTLDEAAARFRCRDCGKRGAKLSTSERWSDRMRRT